ncbi:hypothetical protein [Kutzneria sp. NPDC051319]|uniref:hypothetical protein n=1 Tax=Kutzneria sp. NPDC051319 TaxID=3155047 RepID=UPI003420B8CA
MIITRVPAGPIERLIGHPRLPLIAGIGPDVIHIWDGQGAPQVVAASGPVAWHPTEPLLLNRTVRWTPDGVTPSDLADHYDYLAFSPDGETVFASPSEGDWDHADAITNGRVESGPRWDTGLAVHPAGGLAVALQSEQGATLAVFARVDRGALRLLDRALILDADGYRAPIFSADGRHIAIRGNAYENTVAVFEFPSLRRVLSTTLGTPFPGYPIPDDWRAEMHTWSRHNIAFGAALWIGTPSGSLVEVDIADGSAVEHDELVGAPITALAAMATGNLVVASAGELVLVAGATPADPVGVEGFLTATNEIPADADVWSVATKTDGTRSWDDLATVTEAEPTDPTWLRLQAEINSQR